jgi:hypothetical protein
MEMSPIELQSSPDLDKHNSDRTLTINSEDLSDMTADIRNTSMYGLFNQEIIEKNKRDEIRPSSKLEVIDQMTHHPSMVEINKFKTFNVVKVDKRTVVEPSERHSSTNTRRKKLADLSSKFASHTIQ